MSETILLVDDDSAFRISVKTVLELEGYQVIDVDDGFNALPIIEKQEVDLVITDILMPEIEGNELASKAKGLKPNLKIIGMTGGGGIGDASRVESMCVKMLFEVILKKPFLSEDLLAAISKALS